MCNYFICLIGRITYDNDNYEVSTGFQNNLIFLFFFNDAEYYVSQSWVFSGMKNIQGDHKKYVELYIWIKK